MFDPPDFRVKDFYQERKVMTMNHNEVRTLQLGQPFGTANAVLRKMLLYDMAKRLDEDKCYRCGTKIASIDDFSIDHIINWLHSGRAIELFFDLNNVAFSHVLCNTKAGRKPGNFKLGHTPKQKRVAPDGMAWCGHEQLFKSIDNFTSNKYRWNGVQDICKDCRKVYRNK